MNYNLEICHYFSKMRIKYMKYRLHVLPEINLKYTASPQHLKSKKKKNYALPDRENNRQSF